MSLAFISHSDCGRHDTGWGHPEHVGRLRAIPRALREDPELFHATQHVEGRHATEQELALAHDPAYIARVRDLAASGGGRLDADTVLSDGSWDAARAAAGCVLDGVDMALDGRATRSFAAVRPPGHHAEHNRAMGFCLFNNVAIGALHARATHGIERIAVIDFDVHHGNGTQDIFWEDENTLYISTHQMPLYPGTGDASEHGVAHNILNLPLPPGAGSPQFRATFREQVIPALERFKPEFLFISAGFDAHAEDPLANLRLTEADFAWATRELCVFAAHACAGRVVSTLEGGYDLEALARSAAAHVRALMEF